MADSRPSLDLPRVDAVPVTDGVVTPADRSARLGPHAAPHRGPGTPGGARRPVPGDVPTLRSYLGELFTDGGATIGTPSAGDPGRLVGRTVVQPDGDLVTTLAPGTDTAPTGGNGAVEELWAAHLRDVDDWLAGLRVRLEQVVRRLDVTRLGVFAVLPLLTALAALVTGSSDGGWAGELARVAAIAAGGLSVTEMAIAVIRPVGPGETAPEHPSPLHRLRASSAYNTVLTAAPAVLTGLTGLLRGVPTLVVVGLAVPLAAIVVVAALVLWARRRYLGQLFARPLRPTRRSSSNASTAGTVRS